MAPFERSISFDASDPASAAVSLAGLPEAPGVFALYAGEPESANADRPSAQPYISKTANLRRRLRRLLRVEDPPGGKPAASPSRRLQLARLIKRIDFTVTGSEFESMLALYQASLAAFGDRARQRLHLKPPVFLRMSVENPYPRVYVTTRIAKSAAHALFGPFPSRAAAERYAEAALNLFVLRRCVEDLHPDPAFPGCPYSEMKMCLAPCFKGCTDERYGEEAAAVLAFLSTQGGSTLQELERRRDAASEELDFERAATLHQRMQKVKSAAALASEAVRPLDRLDGILVQLAREPGQAALFRLRQGILSGPVTYSTSGMRLANEQAGSTSLFTQPFVVEPIPLADPKQPAELDAPLQPPSQPPKDLAKDLKDLPKNLLDRRLDEAFQQLGSSVPVVASAPTLADHLALFARWFYRPASRRVGEIVFAADDGQVPRKALLRAISRVVARASSG